MKGAKGIGGYRLVLVLILAAAAFGWGYWFPGKGNQGHGVSRYGALHVEGAQLKGENGETVVLHGMSSHGIAWYPRYLNGAAMDTLYSLGANVQRLAVYTDAEDGYLQDPRRNLDYLYMGVESALAADLYVIVDWHILEDGDPNEYVEEAAGFFDEISGHYGNHPGVIYEICNEPNGAAGWEEIVRYANQVIPVIRRNAPDAIVLVGTPDYCTDFSGPIRAPLSFQNVMYTMHRYIDAGEAKPCDTALLQSVVEAGVPVFVSEWGTVAEPGAGEGFPENALPFLRCMEEQQISWTAWALSNKQEAHSALRPDCEKWSHWDEGDLTAFGRLVFSSF